MSVNSQCLKYNNNYEGYRIEKMLRRVKKLINGEVESPNVSEKIDYIINYFLEFDSDTLKRYGINDPRDLKRTLRH